MEDCSTTTSERLHSSQQSFRTSRDIEARLETAQAGLEEAREASGDAHRALEVLLGRYPAAEIEVASAHPHLPPPVAAGVPASLLLRRPDLVAAEQTVLAGFRQQEAAELALLPDFSISIAGGRLGDQILSLLRLNPWFATADVHALRRPPCCDDGPSSEQ